MSLLFVDQTDDCIILFTDTLTTINDGDPYMFSQKVYPLPHLNMAMTALGSSNLGYAWLAWIEASPGTSDIDTLNTVAPVLLRRMWADLKAQFGDEVGTSTIYHFGFPTGSTKAVTYTYRSTTDFEPERFEGSRFTAKPVPPEYAFDRPQSAEGVIDLAVRVRDLNGQQLGVGWGVAIGGELYVTLIENWSIHTRRIHRFNNYWETAKAIHARR